MRIVNGQCEVLTENTNLASVVGARTDASDLFGLEICLGRKVNVIYIYIINVYIFYY